jgi:DNA-binding transcriptional LysR family regulator
VQTQLTNIPTDLLRTLIALVDLRSFTRAAHSLGITQPAVSAQIKRLQTVIGTELLDKSAPGVTLTANGEAIVMYARRLLSVNDQILDLAAQGRTIGRLRIGIPAHHHESTILRLAAEFRARHPEFQVQVCSEPTDALLREFRRGEFDLVLASADEEQAMPPRWSWIEKFAWAGTPQLLAADGPIPLAVIGEGGLTRRLAVRALEEAGQPYEIVYLGKSFGTVAEAVRAGLGIACWAKDALTGAGLHAVDQTARLPRLDDTTVGIFIGAGHQGSAVDDLAGRIAAAICPAGATTTMLARAG